MSRRSRVVDHKEAALPGNSFPGPKLLLPGGAPAALNQDVENLARAIDGVFPTEGGKKGPAARTRAGADRFGQEPNCAGGQARVTWDYLPFIRLPR